MIPGRPSGATQFSSIDRSAFVSRHIPRSRPENKRLKTLNTQCVFGGDPFEPLERTIQVINRVIAFGERAHIRRSGSSTGAPSSGSEGNNGAVRWVQFGAVSSARVSLADLIVPGKAEDHNSTAALLQEYLALPVEQYSLLDPKWVQRDLAASSSDSSNRNAEPYTVDINVRNSGGRTGGQTFRVSVPLMDMVGVDLRPEVSISAYPDPAAGRVTLVGSRAALGSPSLDDAFRLSLVAVLSRRQRPRRGLPDHIPGRPVMRLRRWAARARGRTTIPQTVESSYIASETGLMQPPSTATKMKRGTEGDDELHITSVDVNDPSSSAPFPSQQVYLSRDDEDLTESDDEGRQGDGAHVAEVDSNDAMEGKPVADSNGHEPQQTDIRNPTSSNRAEAILLDCRVNLTMAVRVPGALRVVPNPLLGYAGSLIVRSALSAALPNFLGLLTADFRRWVEGGGTRDPTMPLGDLFTQVVTQKEEK